MRCVSRAVILAAACAAASGAAVGAQQDRARALYQQALHEEEALGHAPAAIGLYEQVIASAPDHRLAATAALRAAALNRKIGRTDQARLHYERIVARYEVELALADVVEAARTALRLTVKAGGGAAAARQVWTGPTVDPMGTLSADGRYLSFTDWSSGDLAVRDLKENATRRLTNTGGWAASGDYAEYSAISPDGRQVAYAWFVDKSRGYEIRVIPSDSRDPARARTVFRSAETTWIRPTAWTADRSRLLVVRQLKDQTVQMAFISLTGGSLQVVKSLDWRYPEKVALSPDNRFIAYDVAEGDAAPAHDIFVLATDGSRESAVVRNPANDHAPLWSPDGGRLVFLSDRTGTESLWTIGVVDGKPAGSAQLVKPDIGRVLPLGVARGGGLYYHVGGGGRNGYVADLNADATSATDPMLVTERFLNSNGGGTWSRDGDSLAYFSFRGPRESRGSTALVIRSIKTGEERETPIRLLVDYGLRSAPKWFPDGRSVLVVSRDEQSRAFRYNRIDLTSGAAELLHTARDNHSDPANSPEITPDGQAMLFVEQESADLFSNRRLMRLDLRSRQVTEVARLEITSFALSPDGRQIAYLRYDGSSKATSVEVMPAGGGDPRTIFRATPWTEATRYAGLAWTTDQRALLFVRREKETPDVPQALWRIPVVGGAPVKTGLAGPSISIRSQSIHPSGRRIAFMAGAETPREVWVLENFLSPTPARAAKR